MNNFGAATDMNAVERTRFQPYTKKRKLDEKGNFTSEVDKLAGIKLQPQTQPPAKLKS